MPRYDYKCSSCGTVVEVLQNWIGDTLIPPIEDCKACKGKMKRLISNNSFILNGDGWAKDNYHKKQSKGND